MTKKKNEPVLILQIRSYQEPTKFVDCYVIKRHEHADQSLLWGEVLPEEAERVAALFGDNVERHAQSPTEPRR